MLMNYIKAKVLLFFSLVLIIVSGCGTDKKVDKESKSAKLDSVSTNKKESLDGLTLFKEYKFGQSIDEFKNNKEYEDCTDFFEAPAYCKYNVKFLDNEFSAGLIFKDSKLERVILDTEYDEELLSQIILSLPQNNFFPVAASDSKENIDIVHTIKTKGQAYLEDKLNSMESRMPNESDVSFSFVEIKSGEKGKKNYSNMLDVYKSLPIDAREIAINIYEEDGVKYIYLTFLLARNELNNLTKKESF